MYIKEYYSTPILDQYAELYCVIAITGFFVIVLSCVLLVPICMFCEKFMGDPITEFMLSILSKCGKLVVFYYHAFFISIGGGLVLYILIYSSDFISLLWSTN